MTKCHISATVDNFTKYVYGLDYVLSNGDMNFTLQGQGHSIQISEIEKMTRKGNISGQWEMAIIGHLWLWNR